MISPNERTPDLAEIVILGVSRDGEVFRPSNWWERLCDMMSQTGHDGRVIYSTYLLPRLIQNFPSVVVRLSLEEDDPHAYEVIKQFVSMHQLRVRAGRNRMDMRDSGQIPAIHFERRAEQAVTC